MSGKFIVYLRDYFQAAPDWSLASLGVREKVKLMDSVLQKGDTQKGLRVRMRISSSGKRINNRIYTPNGHKAGLDTWLNPYPKPVILNHDKKSEPFGRLEDIKWVPQPQSVNQFLQDGYAATELERVFSKQDPMEIYDFLNRHNLLFNKDWPGVGAVYGTARITDEAAVEKFLDGRYLTLSAGQRSDHYWCGICGSDWVTGDICDHPPGSIEDGKVAVFITGTLRGAEVSVVNEPADSLSQAVSIEVADSEFTAALTDHDKVDTSTIYLADYTVDRRQSEPEMLDARTLAQKLFNSELSFEDAGITGDTHLEIVKLVSIHDALHYEYDWHVRSNETDTIPMDVYKLHAKLHELAVGKQFRDSLINGPLDEHDASGSMNGAFVMKTADEILEKFEQLFERLSDSTQNPEEPPVPETNLKPDHDGGDEFPWWLRSDPQPTEDQLTEAETLLEDESLSEASKQILRQVLEDCKPKPECNCEDCHCGRLAVMTSDYEAAVNLVEEAKAESGKLSDALDKALQLCAKLQDRELGEFETLEDKVSWLDTEPETKENTVPKVDNPSASGGEYATELTDYQKQIVERYKMINDRSGSHSAQTFLFKKIAQGYLPKDFNLSSLIEE